MEPEQIPPVNAIDRLVATLEAAEITFDMIARDFLPTWRVWLSEVDGVYHAMRRGHFQESQDSPRIYHVAAASPARLAVLLLAQTAFDEEVAEQAAADEPAARLPRSRGEGA